MVEENKKETKEALKRQAKAKRGLLKAVTLAVGLNGAVAGHAEAKTYDDPEPQGVEVTYEPQSNIRSSEQTITMEQAEAIARASANERADDASYRTQQDVMTPDEYADAHGLIYDARLSRGLDRYGDGRSFFGYAGAYINPYAEMSNEQVVFLPNDMFYNKNAIRNTSLGYAQASQEGRTDMYFPNKYQRHYEGVGRRYPEAGRKVRKAVRVIEDVIDIVNVIGAGNRR